MLLRTLGGLAFEGSNFSRPKPLLLLAYLALEGPQERRHLAELFWPQATDHLRSLTVALSQLRQSAPSIIRADDKQVEACVDSDAKAFLVQIEQSAWEEALELYQGPFLDGFYLKDWGEELEEWVYVTRERLAGHARAALMTLGEQAATQGEFDRARKHAEAAYRLRGSDLLEPAGLGRLHRLLLAGGSAYAAEVAREAKSFGVAVATSEVEARKELHDLQPKAPIRSNLPTPPTPFVGRRMELAELDRLLLDESNCRLLTLIGPGGIGKTRLALEAASAAVGGFAHGVFFASLAPVTSASGMPSAIAEALGFRFYSEALPKQQLLDYLREKQMLIVLDNFEHLLAATDFVTEILAAARGIKLLITSRESLHLQEEWRYPMEGLSFPRETSQAGENYDALTLFESCARRAQTRFPLKAKRAELVRVCQLVEGMPLALELAASWLHVLPLEAIVRELERGIDILSARHHNLPERHRSMRAVLEQSWGLLSEEEQSVLKRLSVLYGFDREAGERVAGASLATLAALVEKSFLQVSEGGRYGMHELVRQFAAEKLSEDPAEERAARGRQRAFYFALLKGHERQLSSSRQQHALQGLRLELANLDAAWRWALVENLLADVNEVLKSYFTLLLIIGRLNEGAELFSDTIASLQQMPSAPLVECVRARALIRLGACCYLLGKYMEAQAHIAQSLERPLGADYQSDVAFAYLVLGDVAAGQGKKDLAEARMRQSLRLSEAAADDENKADALHELAHLYASYGNYADAKQLGLESLAISEKLGRPDWIAYALEALGWTFSCLGEYGEAEACHQRSAAIFEEAGNRRGVAMALGGLGWIRWCMGENKLEEAKRYLEQSLAISRELGSRLHISNYLGDLELVANELGDYETTRAMADEGVAIARELESPMYISYHLTGLGDADARRGDFATSRKHLLEALQTTLESQLIPQFLMALYYFSRLLVAEAATLSADARRQQKTKALTWLSFLDRHPKTWFAFRERAQRLIAELDAELPAEVAAEAKVAGENRSLEEVASELKKRAHRLSHE